MFVVEFTVEERLLSKIIVDDEGCWLWQGVQNGKGYGYIRHNNLKRGVHRVSYEIYIGPIPEGMHIDHLCRVRHCCNPEHLEAVTVAENNRRMILSNR